MTAENFKLTDYLSRIGYEGAVSNITLDPFYRHAVALYEITEFTPTMTSHDLAFLK